MRRFIMICSALNCPVFILLRAFHLILIGTDAISTVTVPAFEDSTLEGSAEEHVTSFEKCSLYCTPVEDGPACNPENGECFDCEPLWHGPRCNLQCDQRCAVCERETGLCTKCIGHYYPPPSCNECVDGWYGDTCQSQCAQELLTNCGDLRCHKSTGNCVTCPPNYALPNCAECSTGHHGDNCTERCGEGCDGGACHRSNGSCPCLQGWVPPSCTERQLTSPTSNADIVAKTTPAASNNTLMTSKAASLTSHPDETATQRDETTTQRYMTSPRIRTTTQGIITSSPGRTTSQLNKMTSAAARITSQQTSHASSNTSQLTRITLQTTSKAIPVTPQTSRPTTTENTSVRNINTTRHPHPSSFVVQNASTIETTFLSEQDTSSVKAHYSPSSPIVNLSVSDVVYNTTVTILTTQIIGFSTAERETNLQADTTATDQVQGLSTAERETTLEPDTTATVRVPTTTKSEKTIRFTTSAGGATLMSTNDTNTLGPDNLPLKDQTTATFDQEFHRFISDEKKSTVLVLAVFFAGFLVGALAVLMFAQLCKTRKKTEAV